MDDKEFDRQLEELYPVMHRWASRRDGTPVEQEELVHETVERILTKRAQFNSTRGLKSWASAIMKNCFYDRYRRAGYRRTDSLEDMPDFDPGVPAPQESYCDAMKACALLQEFPEPVRKAFSMSLAGHKDREVAEILQVPLGTAKAWIRRTRQQLQERLALT